MNTNAREYAARVWEGQSTGLNRIERARRVNRALLAQGLDGRGLLATLSNVDVDKIALQVALPAFNSGGLDAVQKAISGTGLDVSDVLKATTRYLALKRRKARRERLHS